MKLNNLVFLFLLFNCYLCATIINVPADQPTIQEGIDVSVDGDTVLVQTGIYVENINFSGKNITVASLFLTTQDTIYISQTIIDGNQDGSVVTFESGEDSTAVLYGFTIQNGFANNGGGIYIINNSIPILKHLKILNNLGTYGGGFFISGCFFEQTFDHIIFDSNMGAGNGGNLYISNSTVSITNSIINHGDAFSYGGGIICSNSDLDFEKVQINNNCASFGAGIYSGGCDISLRKSMIINNGSESGSAIMGLNTDLEIINSIIADNGCYEHGVISCSTANDVYIINSLLINNTAQSPNGSLFYGIDFIFNSIIWNNTEPHLSSSTIVHYSDIQNGWTGISNIDADPLFINPDNGDFHLQDSSPCIGAGIDHIEITGNWYYAPLFDIEGNPRPNPAGSMPDMGAYENPLGEPQVSSDDHTLPVSNNKLYNYPNPFNPETTISFNLTTENTSLRQGYAGQAENTELVIYNLKGQRVKQFSIDNCQSSIVWYGKDESGKPVGSGIYFYQLKVDHKTIDTKKCLLLK
ncbi:MAG: hypothetical protein KAU01_11075 [Candidatus Cloacimonetes bacterium]|nr:hypothetical protein [Candidatus Cloacimonadota bacterium]